MGTGATADPSSSVIRYSSSNNRNASVEKHIADNDDDDDGDDDDAFNHYEVGSEGYSGKDKGAAEASVVIVIGGSSLGARSTATTTTSTTNASSLPFAASPSLPVVAAFGASYGSASVGSLMKVGGGSGSGGGGGGGGGVWSKGGSPTTKGVQNNNKRRLAPIAIVGFVALAFLLAAAASNESSLWSSSSPPSSSSSVHQNEHLLASCVGSVDDDAVGECSDVVDSGWAPTSCKMWLFDASLVKAMCRSKEGLRPGDAWPPPRENAFLIASNASLGFVAKEEAEPIVESIQDASSAKAAATISRTSNDNSSNDNANSEQKQMQQKLLLSCSSLEGAPNPFMSEDGRVIEGRSWCRTRCAIVGRGSFGPPDAAASAERRRRSPAALAQLAADLRRRRVPSSESRLEANAAAAGAPAGSGSDGGGDLVVASSLDSSPSSLLSPPLCGSLAFYDTPITADGFYMEGADPQGPHARARAFTAASGGGGARKNSNKRRRGKKGGGEGDAAPSLTPVGSGNAPIFHSEPAPRLRSKPSLHSTSASSSSSSSYDARMSSLEMAAIFHRHAWEGLNSSAEAAASDPFGRGIIFSGDSVVRELFVNVVAALRGHPHEVIEMQYQTDIAYIAYADGTDAFSSLEGGFLGEHCGLLRGWFGHSGAFAPPAHYARGSRRKRKGLLLAALSACDVPTAAAAAAADPAKKRPLFILLFALDRVPNDDAASGLSIRRDLFEMTRPLLRIGGYMFWLADALTSRRTVKNSTLTAAATPLSPALPRLSQSLDGFAKRMGRYLAADRRRRYVWLTTPFSGMAPKTRGDMGHVPTRNAKARRWLLAEGDAEDDNNSAEIKETSSDASSDGGSPLQANAAATVAAPIADGAPLHFDRPLLPEDEDHRPQWEESVGALEREDADMERATRSGELNASRAAAVMPSALLQRWRAAAAVRRSRLCGLSASAAAEPQVISSSSASSLLAQPPSSSNNALLAAIGGANSGNGRCRRQQRFLLDMAGIADVGYADVGLRPRRDRLHYTCGWNFPPRGGGIISGLWANPYNCADPFNRAVVHHLMGMLLAMDE